MRDSAAAGGSIVFGDCDWTHLASGTAPHP